jgi:AmmeMemoRadiSam system protein B
MMTRMPIVAGMFYDASPSACRRAVQEFLEQAELPETTPSGAVGGLVPHAGWVCSGSVAALTFKALLRDVPDDLTLLLLGAVHAHSSPHGMLWGSGAWHSPLGEMQTNSELADEILRRCPEVHEDPAAHATEHSLEVQLPFIQVLAPNARIVPLMVPPSPLAAMIGAQLGRVLQDYPKRVLVVGSSDLTHYGPRYGMTPAGVGRQGIAWAN